MWPVSKELAFFMKYGIVGQVVSLGVCKTLVIRLCKFDSYLYHILRGGAAVAREAHNLKVGGSNPLPATNGFVA